VRERRGEESAPNQAQTQAQTRAGGSEANSKSSV